MDEPRTDAAQRERTCHDMDVLELELFLELVRRWHDHWVEVGRIADAQPAQVRERLATLPQDPDEGLRAIHHLLAVSLHRDAIEFFAAYLHASLHTIEALAAAARGAAAAGRARDDAADPSELASLRARVAELETLVRGAGSLLLSVRTDERGNRP